MMRGWTTSGRALALPRRAEHMWCGASKRSTRRFRLALTGLGLVGGSVVLNGCGLGSVLGAGLSAGLHRGLTAEGPRDRVGSLPFPGDGSLWETADAERLGTHVSERFSALALGETGRGTIYTCKAGFIDLAHLRGAADWTRFAHDEVLAAIRAGRTTVRFADHFHGEYEVDLVIPAGWERLSPADREVEEQRAARRAGQRIAYLAMSWHEVATWFGDRTIAFIPEDRSAFTYDDVIAHVIGVRLGGEALAAMAVGEESDFDLALTDALHHELRRLGALSEEETAAAAERVEGRWWNGEQCMKRQVAIGLDEQAVTPWLVPGFGPCAGQEPEPQVLTWERTPSKSDAAVVVADVRMRAPAFTTKIGLPSGAGPAPDRDRDHSYAEAADSQGWLAAKTVMRVAMDAVKASMRESLGVDFDQPDR